MLLARGPAFDLASGRHGRVEPSKPAPNGAAGIICTDCYRLHRQGTPTQGIISMPGDIGQNWLICRLTDLIFGVRIRAAAARQLTQAAKARAEGKVLSCQFSADLRPHQHGNFLEGTGKLWNHWTRGILFVRPHSLEWKPKPPHAAERLRVAFGSFCARQGWGTPPLPRPGSRDLTAAVLAAEEPGNPRYFPSLSRHTFILQAAGQEVELGVRRPFLPLVHVGQQQVAAARMHQSLQGPGPGEPRSACGRRMGR